MRAGAQQQQQHEDIMEMESIPDENDQQYVDFPGDQPQEDQIQQSPGTLQLEELEKVFEMFHMQNGANPMTNRNNHIGSSFREC